jgi:undecaprenyl-diphosphatase
MLLFEIILLSIVQGIGEFLPISSSGHVVVLANLFNQFGRPLPDIVTVNIALHLGTLLSILVVYWRRILGLLGQDRRVIGLLLAGTMPAAIFGVYLKMHLKDSLDSALVAGCMFPLTGLLLLWTTRRQPGELTCRELTYGRALVIGVFQALAIFPGISRSGSTIIAGLGTGLKREEAATFSFLLAIPAILGAGLLESLDLMHSTTPLEPFGLLGLGLAISAAIGILSLWWLLRWLEQGRLHLFAWWVLLLGPAVVAWQLCR